MRIVIRNAEPRDSAALSDLARRIYIDTFGATDNPEDQRLFLSNTYTPEKQRQEICDSKMVTILVECDGVLGAYAQLRPGHTLDCIEGPAPLEIMRFYVEKSFHGQGVAQKLMAEIEEIARGTGARTLWLGVWEHNERAKTFYRKLGFREVGKKDFHVGTDRQTDLVFERPLSG